MCVWHPDRDCALLVAVANQEIGVPRRADTNQDNLGSLVSAVRNRTYNLVIKSRKVRLSQLLTTAYTQEVAARFRAQGDR
jgi:hypothetical protein